MRRDRVGFLAGFAFAAGLMGWVGTTAFADGEPKEAKACCSGAAAKCGADGAECCKGKDAKCAEGCCNHADGSAGGGECCKGDKGDKGKGDGTSCKAGCCKHKSGEKKSSAAGGCCKKHQDHDTSGQ